MGTENEGRYGEVQRRLSKVPGDLWEEEGVSQCGHTKEEARRDGDSRVVGAGFQEVTEQHSQERGDQAEEQSDQEHPLLEGAASQD